MNSDHVPLDLVVRMPGTFDRKVTPNKAHGHHWTNTSKLKDEMRSRAKSCVYSAVSRADLARTWFDENDLPLTLNYVVFWEKGRRRIDDDNVKASMKSFQDGIADALGINDRNMKVGTIEQHLFTKHKTFPHGSILVTITANS